MKKQIFLFLAIMPIVSVLVCANVVIQQVLYDPINTESGGEAVELLNTGSSAVNIGNWTLMTESSAKDATIPENTVLQPGRSFLIADKGWDDNRDNPEWSSADLEETITLTNDNAGVALVDGDGETVDAVGWGDAGEIKDGLFEGVPCAGVEPGQALFRIKDSDDNSDDFNAHEPMFIGSSVFVEAIVNSSFSARIVEDDDAEKEGVQISSSRKSITVEAPSGFVSLQNQSVEVVNGRAVLSLEGFSAGSYSVFVQSGDDQVELKFEYLALTQFSFSRSIRVGRDFLKIKNEGNVPVQLKVSSFDLKSGNSTISKNYLFINGDSLKDDVLLPVIMPGEEKSFACELDAPSGAKPGTYVTAFKIESVG